ncbi:alpha-hydroxy-acid oxidizing protein [Cohaesibacter haloalkalitolerans]|uniref:alpha-hydroxy-acid oxidizing protein n=1 Tax=Cohaesibacter haloalkalitolerans TaxID=1162980 RepID=UPI000E64D475|nr:alpha-hydroxy-acid oxidizing protein [Cohaesibacter haloalkalitolerans]
MSFLSYDDARKSARRKLPRGLFDYIDRGVGEEASLKRLRVALDEAEISPRILSGLVDPDLRTELFGKQLSAPFIIAPTAMAGLVHQGGEVALAKAAQKYGIPFCLSTQSLSSVDEIAAAVPELDIWMQIYLWQDLAHSEKMLKRAWDAGVRVTVMADSGIRRGLDVLRYQEKGAKAVMLGRLPIYALASEGMTGVIKALEILGEELSEALRYR